jgi:Bacterial regulatory protein, Fis family
MTSLPHKTRPIEPAVLERRVGHLRQALGANLLGVARRLPTTRAGVGPFEVLAVSCAGGAEASHAFDDVGLPPEIVHRLMVGAGRLDWSAGDVEGVQQELLERWQARRIVGWSLPADRRPSVYAVAIWGDGPAPGSRREETARLGLEALARALAPPDWLPLVALPAAETAISLPVALAGESAVAAQLRRSYERLRDTPGPVLVVGPKERGVEDLAYCLTGASKRLPARPVRQLLASGAGPGLWDCEGLATLSGPEQESLLARVGEAVASRERWIFLGPEGLRDRVRRGELRPDLYWMIASRQMLLPPLNLRRADIPLLLRALWRRISGREVQVPSAVSRALRDAAWPGDLLQLEAEVKRLVHEHPRADCLRRSWFRRQLLLPLSGSAESKTTPISLDEAVAQVERRLLESALRVADGNKTQAARHLRMSRQGFYRKLKIYGLWAPDAHSPTDDVSPDPS